MFSYRFCVLKVASGLNLLSKTISTSEIRQTYNVTNQISQLRYASSFKRKLGKNYQKHATQAKALSTNLASSTQSSTPNLDATVALIKPKKNKKKVTVTSPVKIELKHETQLSVKHKKKKAWKMKIRLLVQNGKLRRNIPLEKSCVLIDENGVSFDPTFEIPQAYNVTNQISQLRCASSFKRKLDKNYQKQATQAKALSTDLASSTPNLDATATLIKPKTYNKKVTATSPAKIELKQETLLSDKQKKKKIRPLVQKGKLRRNIPPGKSCVLIDENGVRFDLNGEEKNKDITYDSVKPEKFLPEIYRNLLNVARANNNELTAKFLDRRPYKAQILPKLDKKILTIEDAVDKFDVFTRFELIDEILKSDEPIAKGATVTVEDIKSDEMKMDAKRQNVVTIIIPFVKDSYIEEMLRFMCFINIVSDVKKDGGPVIVEAKVAKILQPQNKKGPTNLTALLKEEEYKKLRGLAGLNKNTFSIYLVPNVMASDAMMESIQLIKTKPELAAKVFPSEKMEANKIQKFEKQMLSDLDKLGNHSQKKLPLRDSPKSFNQKQKEVIYAMTRQVNTTFMLFGPSGTGKTYTLVETIRQLLNQESKKTCPDRSILVCTPSNMAGDAIAEAVMNGKFLKSRKIFRIVATSRETIKRNEKLDDITKRKVITDHNEEQICTVYDLPDSNTLKKYKIIICTLGSIPVLRRNVEPGHFSHIFVDEAAQAPEMDVWLVVGQLADPETRLILAGDPRQLGPVSGVNILSKQDKYGYKTSHLARLVEKDVYQKDPRYLIQLTENHRSHPAIVKISSELFYNNTLNSSNPNGYDSLCHLPFLQKPDFPILFHSVTSGSEERFAETNSLRNLAEADKVVYYVEKCLQRGIKAKDIGVVSPYRYHGETIRKLLDNKDITVETVEKFQGSERRVIILPTVRSGEDLGFIADVLRFNTAITRAKHLLIVIGNERSLSREKSWKRFIEYCKQNDSFIK